eukprot:scaffold121438_cov37-Prasinocladus_malaysianus.AAC.1
MPVTIPRVDVEALRMDADFQLDTNPCYVQKITKVKLISSPAVHIMKSHHQDPHQWRRHDDVSTPLAAFRMFDEFTKSYLYPRMQDLHIAENLWCCCL